MKMKKIKVLEEKAIGLMILIIGKTHANLSERTHVLKNVAQSLSSLLNRVLISKPK